MLFPKLLLAAAAAAFAEDAKTVEFDATDYPRHTIAEAMKLEPCEGDGVKDVLFSSELRWQGAERTISASGARLVSRWTEHVGDAEAASRYVQMRSLSEGGTVHWAVVPDGLVPYLEMDLRPGDKFVVYFVFVGCRDRKPLFAIEEYAEPENYEAIDEEDVVI
jgi:hypothetical protein